MTEKERVREKVKALAEEARLEEMRNPHENRHFIVPSNSPNSLADFIKTKEQGEELMRLIKESFSSK